MTESDVREYDAVWREPTRVNYKGLDVWGMGPPSSGGSTVGEALNILEGLPLARPPTARGRCTTSSRRRASRSPTATSTSAIRTT